MAHQKKIQASGAPDATAGATKRGEDTRERILSAAIEEFCAAGFAGASTTRIVQAANCNIRMLYHFFAKKDGLYRAALERVYEQLRDSEDRISFWQRPPREGVAELTTFTFDYMLENPQFPKMVLQENLAGGDMARELGSLYSRSRPLIANLDGLIENGFADGTFCKRPSATDLYLTILSLSFIHISNLHTLTATFGEDLTEAAFLERRRAHAVEVVLGYLGAD